MSENQENKRELNEEEMSIVTGGTEAEPIAVPRPNGNPIETNPTNPINPTNPTKPINPTDYLNTHAYMCHNCKYKLITDNISQYSSCPNCHQNAFWHDMGGATLV